MKISIVGLGYIGMPTGILFAKAGHEVHGYDVNPNVVASLNAGKLHIKEPGLQELLDEVIAAGRFTASTELAPADAFIICVPTPFQEDKTPDLSHVEAASQAVASAAKPGDLVILESTVPVNTTRDTCARFMPEGVLVAHCPETVLPGNMIHELVHNHRVIGGATPKATEAAITLYQSVVTADIHATEAATAEFVKLIENTYRDVNIALANELNMIGGELGLNARAAIKLANLHPRVNIHNPGPGVGGHCIPVDPWFLIKSVARAPILAAAREVNDGMPERVAAAALRLLPDKPRPRVAVLGLAYKANVEDARESPAVPLMKRLRDRGVDVAAHDPHLAPGLHGNAEIESALHGADLAILVTDHREFDVASLSKLASSRMRKCLVLDTRGCLDTAEAARHGLDVRQL